jgi:hypothetical protein
MAANLEITRGMGQSEAVAMALAVHVGKQQAHELVERACRACNETRVTLLAMLDADAKVRAHLSTADLERLLDPRNYTGAADHFVDRVLSSYGPAAPVAHGAARESSESFVDVDGAQIHCRVDGAVGAPVLVLSNSLGADLSMWNDQVDALASRFPRRALRHARAWLLHRDARTVRHRASRSRCRRPPRRSGHRAGAFLRPFAGRTDGDVAGRACVAPSATTRSRQYRGTHRPAG